MPMFVLDFLCIHPFKDENGRMSRLLTLLLLYKAEENARKIIELPSGLENRDSYITTCDWCVYNRIFVIEYVKYENSTLIHNRFYYVSAPANILLKYIDDLHRVWDYQ